MDKFPFKQDVDGLIATLQEVKRRYGNIAIHVTIPEYYEGECAAANTITVHPPEPPEHTWRGSGEDVTRLDMSFE